MLTNYLKIAYRSLKGNRVYTLINVSGLSLGITCAILIFFLVRYHLSFDTYHPDKERIYRIVTELHSDDIHYTASIPPPLGKMFKNDYTFAEKVARECHFEDLLITVKQPDVIKKFIEKDGIAFVDHDFFDIFSFKSIEGSLTGSIQDLNTAIITKKLAKKYFGDENPIGKTITVDNRLDLKVTAIMDDIPANTARKAEIYTSFLSLNAFDKWLSGDDSWGGISTEMQCFVKLRPGIQVAQVEAVMPAYVQKFRANNKNVHVYKLQPLTDMHFDSRYDGVISKKNIWALAIIGIFLIVTACFNFINLATAQALNRSREVGVRKVLGSHKSQIVNQFISETGLITLVSIFCSLALAKGILPWFNEIFNTQINSDFMWNTQLLIFIPILLFVITLLAGLYPALLLSGFKPINALKGRITQQQIGGFNTRRSLMITQFVIAQVLIAGMIVIANQMQYAKQSDLGFNKDAIVIISTGSQDEKTKTLMNEYDQLTGIEKISICASAPAAKENWSTSMRFDTKQEDEIFRVNVKSGDENFLETFKLPLVAGRNLFPSDSIREYLVNEKLVSKLQLTSAKDIIGKNITVYGQTAPVVGVVKDFYNQSFYGEIEPVVLSTFPDRRFKYAVKINTAQVTTTLASLENLWSKTYPEQVYQYEFVDEQIAAFYSTDESLLKLIKSFSFIAIFISCLGLYGLVSFMAVQKTKEIGIRKVLGSSIGQIMLIFAKEFSRLICFAFLVAAPIAWILMHRWLQDFKYRIDIGPSVFIFTILGTLIIAMITVAYKTIRAAIANPIKSIRTE
jgi:putative ABC transport system permease protein